MLILLSHLANPAALPLVLGLGPSAPLGYGLSIWLDLLALATWGAQLAEAVVFSPRLRSLGVLFSVLARCAALPRRHGMCPA